jgi:hypothetical protein
VSTSRREVRKAPPRGSVALVRGARGRAGAPRGDQAGCVGREEGRTPGPPRGAAARGDQPRRAFICSALHRE